VKAQKHAIVTSIGHHVKAQKHAIVTSIGHCDGNHHIIIVLSDTIGGA